ncbi:katanin p80 WD40 repeat-containing subunit B1-like [Lineus longissimus]|uniref:katanin p80 WD40 repeat-containing subunit B1-like n=1 Tax=Lineus longissimus TaxID=88925 RepID=UPI002B4D188B
MAGAGNNRAKRAWKLEEFVAHGGNVNCLALGQKSGRVMVTGGDDKKVNTWAVGKPNVIMSLSGHTSPVETVRFGHNEELVIAGSMSGALKIWDLEAAKIVRTLTGHKANIRSLDFHPYGDFVTSGSVDTTVKLWDTRRKGCIFTYKGHTQAVNCLRFSPDGRWIASAGADGSVKLWDLTAGKLLKEFGKHFDAVNCLEFHPKEFLLASGSSDRSVKFWDLETFKLVSTTDSNSGPIRTICFHPEGSMLFAGSPEGVCTYTWEPSRCIDTLQMGWGNVGSLAMASSSKHVQMVAASYNKTNVSTYVVDLQAMDQAGDAPGPQSPPPPLILSGRKNFITERPATQSTRQSEPKEEPEEHSSSPQEDPGDDESSIADIQQPDDYNKIFHPSRRLTHSPPRDRPFQAPDSPPERDDFKTHVVQAPKEPPSQPQKSSQPPPLKQPVQPTPTPAAREPSKPVAPTPAARETSKPAAPSVPEVVPANRHRPIGLDAEAFLPKHVNPVVQQVQSESTIVTAITRGHDSMQAVMQNRGKNLQIVRALWSGGNVKTALDSAISMSDQAVIVDLLNILQQRVSIWNLELCATALGQLEPLLGSKYENYTSVACNTLRLILKNFSSVIKSNVSAPPSAGVDISREERYHKCQECYKQLMNIRSVLSAKKNDQGKLGSTYRELHLMMNMLE